MIKTNPSLWSELEGGELLATTIYLNMVLVSESRPQLSQHEREFLCWETPWPKPSIFLKSHINGPLISWSAIESSHGDQSVSDPPVRPSIHPSSIAYLGSSRGGSSLSREAETSLFPGSSSSCSGGIPGRPQANRETCSLQHFLGLLKGLLPVVTCPEHLTREASSRHPN